jgi:hypothetical protein
VNIARYNKVVDIYIDLPDTKRLIYVYVIVDLKFHVESPFADKGISINH